MGFLLVTLVLAKSKVDDKKGKARTKLSIGEAHENVASRLKNFTIDRPKNSTLARNKRRVSSGPRNGRMTHVKAILSNPAISSSQRLADKLARAELKSPKMQETFKKLSAIVSPAGKSPGKAASSKGFHARKGVSHRKRKPSKSKRPKKRKKKRHKFARRENSRRKKNPRARLARQIGKSSGKSTGKSANDRYEKSIDFPAAGNLYNSNNDPSFHGDPYVNFNTGVNYPGVGEDINNPNYEMDPSNFPNSYDENTSNFLSGGQAIGAQNFDFMGRPLVQSPSGDPYQNIPYGENFTYPEGPITQNELSKNDGPSAGPYSASNGKNPQIYSGGPQMGFKNFQPPNTVNDRTRLFNNNTRNPNFQRNFPYRSKYQSRPIFLGVGRNRLSSNNANFANPKSTKKKSNKGKKSKKALGIGKLERFLLKSGGSTTETSQTADRKLEGSKNSTGTDQLSSFGTSTKAPVGKSTPTVGNDSSSANETKEVAGQILDKIIEELEDLKLDRNKNDRKEGLPCKLSGSWITTQAGVRIDMLVTNRTVNVSVSELNLPVGIIRQGLLNYTWNVTGHAPFRRGGPFSLMATDNRTKSLAVFVGACRVCQGIDTIEGVWSVAREPRDCRDFQMATSVHNDIFRRTQLLSAIKEKQSGMGLTKHSNASQK